MKHKLLLIYFLILSLFSNAQTQKLNGIVTSNDFGVSGLEVVNLTSKSVAITNNSGAFSIVASTGDEIIFISKNYDYKTIIIKEADFSNTNFSIKLNQKTEQLEEVVIKNKITAPLIPDMQELLDRQIADDKYSQKKNPFGTDGSITYGPDLFKIIKLFTKGKQKKGAEITKTGFKEMAKNNLSKDFFSKSLELKPEEIPIFLEYCDADPKSRTLLENSNQLELIEFLLAKRVEFKKSKRE